MRKKNYIPNKKQCDLLNILKKYSLYPKQAEILESLQNTCLRRNLSSNQRELANKMYLQIRGYMISQEANQLMQKLYQTDKQYIQMILMTYVESSVLPDKDIKKIVETAISFCEKYEIRVIMSNYFVNKFC